MEDDKLIEIVNNVKEKSNKDLLDAEEFLFKQYEDTKKVAIELTMIMEGLEKVHKIIYDEIENRKSI